MTLPQPYLDDRRFQDLVDDAKRLVAARCPEWSDHNVSDPGVTLIEAFAFMTDELFYRLNRVPDKLYIAFLDLIGTTLFPPTPATTELVMWLSAPRDAVVTVPEHTEVGTPRTEQAESIVFQTTSELEIPPRSLAHLGRHSEAADKTFVRDARLRTDTFDAFASPPVVGDEFLLGLDEPAAGLRGPRRRGRSARSAHGVGVVERIRLVAVRPGFRRYGRPQPARRGRGHRAA